MIFQTLSTIGYSIKIVYNIKLANLLKYISYYLVVVGSGDGGQSISIFWNNLHFYTMYVCVFKMKTFSKPLGWEDVKVDVKF